MANVGPTFKILIGVTMTLVLKISDAHPGTANEQKHFHNVGVDGEDFSDNHWNTQPRDPGDSSDRDNSGTRNSRRNRWVAGQSNCSCGRELSSLKRDLREEMRQRNTMKTELDGFLSQLEEISETMKTLNLTRSNEDERITRSKFNQRQSVGVTFSAKLSYNRELKPLDTIVFDAIISNVGGGYDADTGKFTAPTDGTYLFHSTILSGYNTKVETAIIMNDKEVARIYSGAHDAHGSGSNTVALSLSSGDVVWVRLLYQGGNHVHGYYSTFTGTLLAEA